MIVGDEPITTTRTTQTTETTTKETTLEVVEKPVNEIVNFVTDSRFYVPVIAIVLAVIAISFTKKILKRVLKEGSHKLEDKKKNTLFVLIQSIVKYIIIIIAVLISLSAWGIDVTAIITGLGIAGAVAGLAFQDALKDIIMGCNIIMDNYFVIGDVVTYNDFTGEVIEFGLKNTKIKSVDGTVLIVANRQISEIKNLSQKTCALLITIPTAYEEKDKKVSEVLLDMCKSIDEWDITTLPTEYLGVDNLNESSVDYMIKVHCNAPDRYTLKRKTLAFIKNEMDKNGIKIPYPQVEVHNGK